MIQAIIKVNGRYYAGESDKCYKAVNPGSCAGWRNYNNEISVLKFTMRRDEAKILEGNINIKSAIDKIFYRVREDLIDFGKIEIIKIA